MVDETGLKGTYDFTLRYSSTRGPDSDAADVPEVRTAIQEQLGLKLQSRRGSVDYFAIEHAERPGAN